MAPVLAMFEQSTATSYKVCICIQGNTSTNIRSVENIVLAQKHKLLPKYTI